MTATLLDPDTDARMNERIFDALYEYVSGARKHLDHFGTACEKASDAFVSRAFLAAYADYILRDSLGTLLGSSRTKRLRKKRFMPVAHHHPGIARKLSIQITGKAW